MVKDGFIRTQSCAQVRPIPLPASHQSNPWVSPLSGFKHHTSLLEGKPTSPARSSLTAVPVPAVRGDASASAHLTDSCTKGQVKAKDKTSIASQTGSPQRQEALTPRQTLSQGFPTEKKHLIPNSSPAIQP